MADYMGDSDEELISKLRKYEIQEIMDYILDKYKPLVQTPCI